jgi:hypothetical protein
MTRVTADRPLVSGAALNSWLFALPIVALVLAFAGYP